MTTIGFIGACAVGAEMVRRLLAAGCLVRVISQNKRNAIDILVAEGAVEVVALASIARESEVILTCLSDATEVNGIAAQIEHLLSPGQMWIDTTTSDPEATHHLVKRLESRGVVFADAPITGGVEKARAGQLASLVGCRREKFNQVKAVVSAYSSLVQRFGEPGCGHTAKLLNNFVSQSTGMALVEAFERARQAGIEWRALYDVMCAGTAQSSTLERLVGPALEGRFDESQFSIANARKDIGYYRELSERMDGKSSALADAAYSVLDNAVEAGEGENQVSSLLTDRTG